MRFFRALLTVFFAWIIVFWLWKWYATDDSIQKTDIMRPVWDKLASIVTTKQSNSSPTTKNTTTQVIKTNPKLHPDVTTGALSLGDFEKLIENNNWIWQVDADWALLVYCDFDSIYCKQMSDEWTTSSYQLIANDNLIVYNKWYTTSFSWIESTYNTQHAWMCWEKIASWPQRMSLLASLFEFPYQTTQQLLNEWKELWIEWFSECLVSTDSTQDLKLQNSQAKEFFNISSLPTLIFYNKKDQDRYSIPGLYTNEELASTFEVLFPQD